MSMEKILCAATWYKDLPTPSHKPKNIDRGMVLCGHNHAQILHQVLSLTGKKQSESGEYIQGFLTTENRFVDRIEGALIWENQGGKLKYNKKELFSEDIIYHK